MDDIPYYVFLMNEDDKIKTKRLKREYKDTLTAIKAELETGFAHRAFGFNSVDEFVDLLEEQESELSTRANGKLTKFDYDELESIFIWVAGDEEFIMELTLYEHR